MKAQAAASFKSIAAVPGISGGWEGSEGKMKSSSTGRHESTLTWQANGGDTLLCNNPPSWCATVASYQSWRIIDRAENRHIIDLMAKFDHQEDLAKSAAKWRTNSNWKDYEEVTTPKTLPPPGSPPPLFYLRARGLRSQWLYLTVYQQEQIPDNVGMTVYQCFRGKAIPPGVGTVWIRPEVTESNKHGSYFEATPLSGPSNGKPYVLRNPATGLYITCHSTDEQCFLAATPVRPTSEEHLWKFRKYDGRVVGEVKQDDKVTLRRPETPKQHKERILMSQLVPIDLPGVMMTKWDEILCATTNLTSGSELQFDFLLASKWEAKQK